MDKIKEIMELINYAYSEGYVGDEVETWTDKQKEDYYNACTAYDPEPI